jgi:hypothetical protein
MAAFILITGYGAVLHAQFPAPVSFQFSYDYIELDNWGDCNGATLSGPAYCSRFNWSAPDTSGTDATLDHYRIYVNDVVFTQVEDTFYTIDQGFTGKLYITAVYADPSGESDSSNVVYNSDLPISTSGSGSHGELLANHPGHFIYNWKVRQLIIADPENAMWLKVYNITGKESLSVSPVPNTIDVSGLGYGVYIIESNTRHRGILRQKIVIRK